MLTFPNIENNWKLIAHRRLQSDAKFGYCHPASLKGRGFCLIHLLATPLIAISSLNKLVRSTIEVAIIIFAVLTLNVAPKRLLQAPAKIIDVALGILFLSIALVANIIRGVIGTIFYPGAMIKNYPPIYANDYRPWYPTIYAKGYR